MLRNCARRRRGATLVEMAIVSPVILLLILGLIIGGMGIYRYQEVAHLAREGARYASVRGTQYQQEVTGATAATPQSIYDNAIAPQTVVLDLSKLSYQVTWNSTNSPYTTTNFELPVGNTVSVTVTYQWFPEWFLIGPITFSSTATLPMTY
jgi:Flp pilus assembly protein TadG